jgi:hypothetical protein
MVFYHLWWSEYFAYLMIMSLDYSEVYLSQGCNLLQVKTAPLIHRLLYITKLSGVALLAILYISTFESDGSEYFMHSIITHLDTDIKDHFSLF